MTGIVRRLYCVVRRVTSSDEKPRTPSVLEYWVESTRKDSEDPSEEAGLSGKPGALVDAIFIGCLPRVGPGFLLEVSLTAGK